MREFNAEDREYMKEVKELLTNVGSPTINNDDRILTREELAKFLNKE